MNEKEIIKQLKDSCILDNNCYEVDFLYEKDLEAIRSLFKLYNKEKQKNNKILNFIKKLYGKNYNNYELSVSLQKLLFIIGE